MQRGARSVAVPTAGIFHAVRTSMNRADVRRGPTCRSFLKTEIRATHTAMNLRRAHNPYKWTRHWIARGATVAKATSNPVLEDHQAAECRHRSSYERGRYRQHCGKAGKTNRNTGPQQPTGFAASFQGIDQRKARRRRSRKVVVNEPERSRQQCPCEVRAEIERQDQEGVDPPRHDPVAQADRDRYQRRPQDQWVPKEDDGGDSILIDLVEEIPDRTHQQRPGRPGTHVSVAGDRGRGVIAEDPSLRL